MVAATVTRADQGNTPFEIVTLTATSTTVTYQSKRFAEIVGAWATNTSDSDGVAVSWSGVTVTLVVGTANDVVYLMIAGRK